MFQASLKACVNMMYTNTFDGQVFTCSGAGASSPHRWFALPHVHRASGRDNYPVHLANAWARHGIRAKLCSLPHLAAAAICLYKFTIRWPVDVFCNHLRPQFARTGLHRQLTDRPPPQLSPRQAEFATHNRVRSPVRTQPERKDFGGGTLCPCIRLQLRSPDALVPRTSTRYQDECLPHVHGRSHNPSSSEPAGVASASGRCAGSSTSLVHSIQATHQYCTPQRQS